MARDDCQAVIRGRNRLPLAIVGLGHRGWKHLEVARSCAATEVIAVCDGDARRLGECGDVGVRLADALAMADEARPEAAVLVLPHSAYYEVVAEYAARGIALLKEKPLARSFLEAHEIRVLLDAWPVPFAVAAQRRHSAVFQALAAVVAVRGAPRAFEFVYTLGLPAGGTNWRAARDQAGGGAVLDMGYHALDVLTALFGVPEAVAAVSGLPASSRANAVEDEAGILLRYGGGAWGTLLIGRHFGPAAERLTLWYADDTILVDETGLRIVTPDGGADLVARRESTPQLLHRQLHDFIRLVSEGTSRSCSLQQALATTVTTEMCYGALWTGDLYERSRLEERPLVDPFTPAASRSTGR